jgi:ParB-like chromosome segregation protein Spo0J
MRIKKDIPLDQIDIDRMALCPTTIRYAVIIQSQSRHVFPAIKVARKSNGRYEIRDGRHRWAAHKLAGEKMILAKFSQECLHQ